MESGITRDAWLKALAEAGCDDGEDDPEAMTVQEFCTLFGLNRQAAERRLRILAEKGLATRTARRQLLPDGRTMRLIAYRLVTP